MSDARQWTDAEECEISDSLPATPSNRFYIRMNGSDIRIAFMERSLSEKKQYARSAVLLSPDTARALRDMLCRLMPQEIEQ